MKIQKRFVSSERSSNCSDYQTPIKTTELRNRKKLAKPKNTESEGSSNKVGTNRDKNRTVVTARLHSQTSSKWNRVSNKPKKYQTVHVPIANKMASLNQSESDAGCARSNSIISLVKKIKSQDNEAIKCGYTISDDVSTCKKRKRSSLSVEKELLCTSDDQPLCYSENDSVEPNHSSSLSRTNSCMDGLPTKQPSSGKVKRSLNLPSSMGAPVTVTSLLPFQMLNEPEQEGSTILPQNPSISHAAASNEQQSFTETVLPADINGCIENCSKQLSEQTRACLEEPPSSLEEHSTLDRVSHDTSELQSMPLGNTSDVISNHDMKKA